MALSLVTRRPVLIGLVYVLLWEGLLTNLLTGTRLLAVQQYAVSVADQDRGRTSRPQRVAARWRW